MATKGPQAVSNVDSFRNLIAPEVLEPVRRQRRVDGRAGDRAMPKPPLDCPGVVALVGEGVAAGVPQACRSMWGCALSSRPAPAAARSIMRAKPAVVNGEPRSLTNTKGDDGLSRWRRRRALISSPWIGWVLGVPFLTRRTWSTAPVEVDLVPAEIADLGGPQAVPVGQQDHGGVAVTVSVAPGGFHQPLDLVWDEVLPGSELGVLLPLRSNCSFYFSWRDQLEMRFSHMESKPPYDDCS
jgi:hypothetical protein